MYVNYIVLGLSIILMVVGSLGVINRKLTLGKIVGLHPVKSNNKIQIFGWSKKTTYDSGKEEDPDEDMLILQGLPAILIGGAFATSGLLMLFVVTETISEGTAMNGLPVAGASIALTAFIFGLIISKYQRTKNKLIGIVNDKEVQKKVLDKIAKTQEEMEKEKR